MNPRKPTTRTEADAPEATRHLDETQKQALDAMADAEHVEPKQAPSLQQKIRAAAAPKRDHGGKE